MLLLHHQNKKANVNVSLHEYIDNSDILCWFFQKTASCHYSTSPKTHQDTLSAPRPTRSARQPATSPSQSCRVREAFCLFAACLFSFTYLFLFWFCSLHEHWFYCRNHCWSCHRADHSLHRHLLLLLPEEEQGGRICHGVSFFLKNISQGLPEMTKPKKIFKYKCRFKCYILFLFLYLQYFLLMLFYSSACCSLFVLAKIRLEVKVQHREGKNVAFSAFVF